MRRSSSRFASAADLQSSAARQRSFKLRLLALAALVLLCFALLAWRWVVLQVLRRETYAAQAESNRTALVPVPPSRGTIMDRNGVVLASNYSAYTLELIPKNIDDIDATIDALAQIIPVSETDRRRFKRLRQDSKDYEPIPLRHRLSDEEIARLATRRHEFPGVEINARLYRYYPYGELSAHVIGYIGRINPEEKRTLEDSEDAFNYRGTTHIGKLGIEQSYESVLHGTSGSERMEITSSGQVVRSLASQPAVAGRNVVLSIDIRLQKMIEDLFGKRRGALVAIDPRDGQVLAMVSKPSFDGNLFVDGIDHENWKALNESINKPLLNRALRGTYPPGSTYKPFMALAALETGARTAGTTIHDPGYWMYGNHRFRSGHALGAVNLRRSIIKSSNVYYYSLAHEMGVQAIHDFMQPLGFGQRTGIDLNGEVRGVLPSPEWKRKTYKRPEQQKWLSGETISLGIGQGYNNFTMLQLAHALATLVNGGNSFAPRLGLYLQDPLTQTQQALERPHPVNLGYKKQHIDLIKSAMVGVTQEGTSRGVFMGAGYTSGGKTGTAQAVTIGQKQRYNAAALAEHKRDHSLYVAFAPADKPVIAIAVIVENAGFGAAAAAPIARRVLDYWLLGQYPSPEDIAATQVGRSSAPIGQRRQVAQMPWPPGGMVASPLAANVPANAPLRGAVGAFLPEAVGAFSGAASAPAVANVPAVAALGATPAPSAAGPVAAAPAASVLGSSAALAPPYAPAPAAQALTTLFGRKHAPAAAAAATSAASQAAGAASAAGSGAASSAEANARANAGR
ncbi:MAG: penicillin-binding protein 2 [Brachymonas sp.]|nr:penicillin-binding protein 2 [Brachymonas sp.]